MTTFIIYCLRWAVCLTLLYSLFGLFMKRETLHAVNRMVLLLILVASMVLPLCQIETRQESLITQSREMIEQQIENTRLPYLGTEKHISLTNGDTGVTHTALPIRGDTNLLIASLIIIYIGGIAIGMLRYLWSLLMLAKLIRQGRRVETAGVPQGVAVVVHPDVKTPCSWMRWIIIHPSDVGVRPIIEHELAHVRLGHSWDMLLCELTCRTLWCVPFARMLRQDLRDVHEYQADRRVLASNINENEYQLLLIRKASGTGLQPVVNALNQSPIKRRFKMMYKKPSRRWMALKAVYLVPLSALTLVAFARPHAMGDIQQRIETVEQEVTQLVAEATRPKAPSPVPMPPAEEAALPPVADSQTPAPELPDSNLVKADLRESSPKGIAPAAAQAKSVTELLDSTMLAVGAQKIGEGTYLGHFQPNLNSDTVRIAQTIVLDRESKQTGEHRFGHHAGHPSAYAITLSAETRKGKSGYYIRRLAPVASSQRHYDRKRLDPKMLSTDNVLTKPALPSSFQPVAIEQSKQETRLYMYVWMDRESSNLEESPLSNNSKQNLFKHVWQMHICDEMTGDKYMIRAMDDSYLKLAEKSMESTDTAYIYQVCLVFPPLGKKVDIAHLGFITKDGYQQFDHEFSIKHLPRKNRIITN